MNLPMYAYSIYVSDYVHLGILNPFEVIGFFMKHFMPPVYDNHSETDSQCLLKIYKFQTLACST